MYKRLKIKVEEEERRRDKEVSFGVLEKNTAHKKQFKRERVFESLFPKKVNFDLFSRPKSALSFWATRKYRMAHMGKKVNFCRQNYFFFPRKEKHFVEEKQAL